jgi:hypothetical protein
MIRLHFDLDLLSDITSASSDIGTIRRDAAPTIPKIATR